MTDHASECPTCGQDIANPKPVCSDCGGRGYVSDTRHPNAYVTSPCPKGCPPAYLINWANTTDIDASFA